MMTRKSTPFFIPRFYLAVLPVLACAFGLMQGQKAGGATVTVCDEASLRAALSTGEEAVFGCDGTIVLSNTLVISTSTKLNGNGHQVVLSGNGMIRVIEVNPGVVFTVDGVGIANGVSTNGAGIYNHGSTVTLLNSTFSNNLVYGRSVGTNAPASNGQGGAIYNDHGVVNLTNVILAGNVAHGATNGVPPSGSIGQGGGILNDGGSVVVDSSRFWGNQARGTDGGTTDGLLNGTEGYPGYGGAIYNTGELRVSLTFFETNNALGGKGGDGRLPGSPPANETLPEARGRTAGGGAIYNSGTIWLTGDTFLANAVLGGKGGNGSIGFQASSPGVGGAGAEAAGGAIFHQANGLVVSACTFASNTVTGGAGGYGGDGYPSILAYGCPGGAGGNGGNAYGGGLSGEGGIINATNNTLTGNLAQGSPGGHGGNGGSGDGRMSIPTNGGNGGNGGSAWGGGIYLGAGVATCVNNTLAFNQSSYGSGGARGEGGGALSGTHGLPGVAGQNGVAPVGGIAAMGGGTVNLANNIVAYSTPTNCMGAVVDAGHNISSDASGSLYAAGSMQNTDPLLGPLVDNGGPTLTMELLPGSPAFDAGADSSCPSTDQRGVPRPQLARCDIGAFEGTVILPPMAVTGPASNIVDYAATLTASVNPNASVPATVYFQWGTTTSYGSTSPVQQLGAGSSNVLVFYRVIGLAADRDYHFRVVATNKGGISYGADQFFRTPSVKPIVTTGLASSISSNSVTLNGIVNPHGPLAATAFFEWGTNTGYGNATPAQTVGSGEVNVSVSASLSGLEPYTLYHCRLIATNQNGLSSGEDHVFKTLPVPVVLSSHESSLRAALLPGEPVSFAVDGTIVLTEPVYISTAVTLDGRGHSVTLSGGNSTRVFIVAPGGNLTLLNLTIANGRSTEGGAIYNQGGSVVIGHCTLSNNYAIALAGNAGSAGTNGVVSYYGGDPGEQGGSGSKGLDARGGAIYNNIGSIVISNSVLVANAAIGGEGGAGGQGGNGAFLSAPGLTYGADGGNGGSAGGGGRGYGGALYNEGSLAFVHCAFSNNWVQGGFGGTGGAGGAAASVVGYPAPESGLGGNGGRGGDAHGGVLFNFGTALVTNCSYVDNLCLAGMGGLGGIGGPATASTGTMNIGGRGGDGGDAYGGAVYNVVSIILAQTTATRNTAAGGTGGTGGLFGGGGVSGGSRCSYLSGRGGNGFGGGISTAGTFTRIGTVISGNQASGGIGGVAETNGCFSFGDFRPPYPNGANGTAVENDIYYTATSLPSSLVVASLTGSSLRLQYKGIPGRTYFLQGAVGFTNWSNIRTNVAGADGRIEFGPVDTSGYPSRVFRALYGQSP